MALCVPQLSGKQHMSYNTVPHLCTQWANKTFGECVFEFCFSPNALQGECYQLQNCLAAWLWQDQLLYLKAFPTTNIPGNPTAVYQPIPVKETSIPTIVIVDQALNNG